MAIITKDGKTYLLRDGTFYHAETPPEVAAVLERARQDHTRLRLFYGYTESYSPPEDAQQAIGEAWPEENDVCGYIGRSTGAVKVPLLVHSARSHGGGAISTNSIVAIRRANSETGAGAWLYKHPKFTTGTWESVKGYEDAPLGLIGATLHNGELHGRHKSYEAAERYAAFMRGERGSK